MNLRSVLIGALLAGLLCGPPLLSAKRLAAAQDQRLSAERALWSVQGDAREVVALRARQQRIETRQRPQEHVLAQVNATLALAGLPGDRLQGLGPEAVIALPGGAHHRQSMRLSFHRMSLAEFGEFLIAWRDDHALWTPTRIEMTRSAAGRRDGEEGRYDVTLILSAVYPAEHSETSASEL